jgi:hypothetical protein
MRKQQAAIDYNNNLHEYLLGTLDNDDVICDPNLWIADTAATVHMTSHCQGLTNLRKITNAGMINMGNSTQEKIEETADIVGTIKSCKEGKRVRIQDVTII